MKYENNNTVADATVYLPLDTKKNAQQFLELVHPDMVFFIKNEWLNYLNELNAKYTYLFNIRIFREQQMFFKWWRFYRKALDTFTYFLCRTKDPKLLQQLGKERSRFR
jgi:3-deoxy-D-manno-octulosonic-acid transferase